MAGITPNKGLLLPTVGGNVNTWGPPINGDLTTLDLNLGGALTLSVAGSSNVTLTAQQAQNLAYTFTGALTGNIEIVFPAGGGFYLITNLTTGAFTLTAITSGVTPSGVVIPAGGPYLVQTDGTTFFLVSPLQASSGPIAVVAATATMPTERLVAINNTSAAPVILTWSASPYDGEEHEIVDYGGNASTYPITIETSGATTLYSINFDNQSVILTYSAALSGYIVH